MAYGVLGGLLLSPEFKRTNGTIIWLNASFLQGVRAVAVGALFQN